MATGGEVAPRGDQLWPFGRYQGQPIDRVMGDHSYLEWILNQPWFLEDYPRLHSLIVNFGNESQDSPEHNAFQIRFLEEPMRLALARRLGYEELDGQYCSKQRAIARKVGRELDCQVHEKQVPLRVSAVKFEESGWDVAFDILPASYVAFLDAKHGKDYVELLESWGKPKLAEGNLRKLKAHHGTLDVAVYEPNSSRRPRVLVELKPDLGDDYPSVLRQIQRYPGGENESFAETGRVRGTGGRGKAGLGAPSGLGAGAKARAPKEIKVLIVRRARFTTVSWEQVKAFFASANVLMIRESEIEDLLDPNVVDAEVVEDGVLEAATPVPEAIPAAMPVDPQAERFDRPSRSARVAEPVAVGSGIAGAAGGVALGGAAVAAASGATLDGDSTEDLDGELEDEIDYDEVEDFFGEDDDFFD